MIEQSRIVTLTFTDVNLWLNSYKVVSSPFKNPSRHVMMPSVTRCWKHAKFIWKSSGPFSSLLETWDTKKERRIEEVGQQIQAAHIQQELCNDSLNPNAKKFSDQKKDLLRTRDELELEIRDVRDRQSNALDKYKPTEEALNKANVPHRHPMEDLEERLLNMRAKMVGYKAMALGHVSSVPLKNEIHSLMQTLDESRKIISRSANRSVLQIE
mmetsp:Transcript_7127/g.8045  ORF Transcript_7127/g.8045 Transcript_7127/m.8045 type:complete len:212 (-) Transcript_7127:153-788(-)